MTKLRLAGKLRHSSVNGPGVRYVLFFQGCKHNCPGCHNPETHDLHGGLQCDTETVIDEILKTRYLDGLTLSGGDPLLQPEAAMEIASKAKQAGLNVWMYTGSTWEEILKKDSDSPERKLLHYLDVLIDGPFIAAQKTETALWRGSSNQRLINVPESLKNKKAIIL